MPLRGLLAATCLLAPALTGGAAAQARTPDTGDGVRVHGHVVDRSTGEPLAGVRVLFRADGTAADSTGAGAWEAVSDSAGRFSVEPMPRGGYELRAEALAFASVSRRVAFSERGTVELRVEMSPRALDLDPIVVTATRPAWLIEAGFYERRELGLGYTLTRAEIEARRPHRVSDLFYGIPGADVIAERDGYRQAQVLLRGRCVPQIVLDGAPFSGPIAIDQVLAVTDLEAVEVYHGASSPVRYSNSSCGTIMMWSRRGTTEGSPLTWKRFLAAAGIVAWFALALWAG